VLFGKFNISSFTTQGYVIPDNVTFTGRIDDATLAGLMQDALCFAMPSRTEGFGLPPLETMLRGSPAIIAPAAPCRRSAATAPCVPGSTGPMNGA
jgi:glycosyltransferase involved in cell wall biosynthesis